MIFFGESGLTSHLQTEMLNYLGEISYPSCVSVLNLAFLILTWDFARNVSCTLSFEEKSTVKCHNYQSKSNHFLIIHSVIFLPEIFNPTTASVTTWHIFDQSKFTSFPTNLCTTNAKCFWLTYT